MVEENTSVASQSEAPVATSAGSLTPQELGNLTALNGQAREVLFNMGLHRQQGRVLDSKIDTLNAQTQSLINDISKRLGIPDGKNWTLDGDKVIIVNP